MMEIEKLIEKLRTESLYKDKATLEIMDLCMDAALALKQLQAENDRLGAELEKEEAARKKQADILYELRGQKYESTTAIDQLRAENDRLKRERVRRQIPVEEARTCEGCVHEINEHENCNYCIRAGCLSDYYCRSQEMLKNE